MFKSRSHWVSARMSESLRKPLPEGSGVETNVEAADDVPALRPPPIVAPAPVADPVFAPVAETRDRPIAPEIAAPEANLPDANAPKPESPAQDSVAEQAALQLAAFALGERHPANESHEGDAKPAAMRAAPLADPTPANPPQSGADPSMPKFLADEPEEGAGARHSLWLVVAAGAVLLTVVLGSLQVGVPDASMRIAALDAPMREGVEPERSVPSASEMVREAQKSEEEARRNQAREDAQIRLRRMREPAPAASAARDRDEPAHMLRFRKVEICNRAEDCGLPANPSVRGAHPPPLDPALVSAVRMQNALAADLAVPAVDSVASAALAAIGEIDIVLLPRTDGSDPAKAEVALRLRDGRELGRIDLNVIQPPDEDEPVAEQGDGPGNGEGVGDEDEGVVGRSDNGGEEMPPLVAAPVDDAPAAAAPATSANAPEAPPPAVSQDDMPKKAMRSSAPHRPTRAKKKNRPRADTAEAQPSAPVEAKPQPRGLFVLDPPQPQASAPEPAPWKAKSAERPAVSPNDFSFQPTPKTLDRPPGMETLMGLGGGPVPDAP